MSPTLADRYVQALLQTLLMVGASMLIAIVAGMLLAIVLTVSAPGGLYPRPLLHKTLSTAINMFRAIPFVILLVALLPVTRFIVGTTLGAWAAVVPLSANLIPFFARIVQVNLGGAEPGLEMRYRFDKSLIQLCSLGTTLQRTHAAMQQSASEMKLRGSACCMQPLGVHIAIVTQGIEFGRAACRWPHARATRPRSRHRVTRSEYEA
nr:hypothetical protein [Paraburkholderia sp. CNPSo 3281]